MDAVYEKAKALARFAGEVVAETLWPTRCALCDRFGEVLCERCMRALPYLDWWRACKRCGSAYGRVQCATCNPVTLGLIGRESLPFSSCASATMFTAETGHIVRVYKDQGEQRLAATMAALMAHSLPADWDFDRITFVPATLAAYRWRGFDHAELIARQLARMAGSRCVASFERPRTRDQRSLSRAQRFANLSSSFIAHGQVAAGVRFLLVDDVFTTGATLCCATDALIAAGAAEVRCLTFARV